MIGLDLAGVKRNLELVSTIDKVSIERILPRTLKIRVTERRPVAQVNLLRTLPSGEVKVEVFQLNVEGFVMEPLDLHMSVAPVAQLSHPLPGITGLNVCELQPGHQLESPQALAALQLIDAFDHSQMAGLTTIHSVDISAPGVLVAATGQGSEVTFALERLDQQLQRWQQIADWGHTVGKEIATVDLAVRNNVPVTWILPAGTPNVDSKSAKPLNSRRKNV